MALALSIILAEQDSSKSYVNSPNFMILSRLYYYGIVMYRSSFGQTVAASMKKFCKETAGNKVML